MSSTGGMSKNSGALPPGSLALAGAGGGLAGAVVMDLILVSTKVALGLPPLADFKVMGASLAGVGPADIAVGAVAHHLVGVVLGALLGLIVALLDPRALFEGSLLGLVALGVVYGLVVYSVLFIPVLVFLFAPTMSSLMGAEAASAMMPVVLGFGLQEHVLYGIAVALSIGYARRRVRG